MAGRREKNCRSIRLWKKIAIEEIKSKGEQGEMKYIAKRTT